MGNNSSSRAAADLQRLAQRFAAWRSRRTVGTRIPEPLWRAAVTLACKQGVGRIALAIGLGYHALKQRVELHTGLQSHTAIEPGRSQARPARRRFKRGVEPHTSTTGLESPRPTFVELSAAHDGALAALTHAALRSSSPDVTLRGVSSRNLALLAGAAQDASPGGARDAARDCRIEWTRATGDTLRIQLTNHNVSEIAALCRQLGSG